MRVEQRIGRIDRLGQKYSVIRIANLHYEGTVEADVYRALRNRIKLFESVVGPLQPILSKLSRTDCGRHSVRPLADRRRANESHGASQPTDI